MTRHSLRDNKPWRKFVGFLAFVLGAMIVFCLMSGCAVMTEKAWTGTSYEYGYACAAKDTVYAEAEDVPKTQEGDPFPCRFVDTVQVADDWSGGRVKIDGKRHYTASLLPGDSVEVLRGQVTLVQTDSTVHNCLWSSDPSCAVGSTYNLETQGHGAIDMQIDADGNVTIMPGHDYSDSYGPKSASAH